MPKQKKSAAPSNGGTRKSRTKRASPLAAAVSAKASVSAVPSAQTAPSRKPTTEQVSARAHQIWLDAGKPQGLALEHWLRAERELS